jgi:hypothetical protein
MQIDIPTVIVIETIASAMSALVLAASLRGAPSPGGREATAAMACLVPAFLVYLLRDRLPGATSIVVANLLFWTTALLVHRAVTRFTARRAPPGWPLALLATAAPVLAVLATSGDWYGLRGCCPPPCCWR